MSKTEATDPVYQNYWARKRLLEGAVPAFRVKRWWPGAGLPEIERLYYEAVAGASSLLDVGAGDLRVMRKFREVGFGGEYHTQDVGREHPYDYHDLAEVRRTYQAVLCLDVLEHLPLRDGLGLLGRLVELTAPGGVLVIQTPNARCVRQPLGWDMTHLHCYNAADLWAYLTALGLETVGYRVAFGARVRSPLAKLREAASAYFITRWVGADYADNIALIARKPPAA